MSREKVKFALRISPETQQLVKDLCPRDNCQSQNEFIEKAIHFYAGHISAKDSVDFLPPVFAATLKGIVQDPPALQAGSGGVDHDECAGIRVGYQRKRYRKAAEQMCPGG